MTEFISGLIGNDYVATVLMSMIPLIELKGGIIFAMASFSFIVAFCLAYVGSTIVFIPIFFLLKPILNGMKKIKWFNKFACKIESYFQTKADETLEKRKKKLLDKDPNKLDTDRYMRLIKQLGVFIFVAIPLPMTGIWTGTAIAVFLGLKFKDTILPIIVGNFTAGWLIVGLAEICLLIWNDIAVLDIILYILFALAVILLVLVIIKIAMQKPKTATVVDEGVANEVAEEEKTDVEE